MDYYDPFSYYQQVGSYQQQQQQQQDITQQTADKSQQVSKDDAKHFTNLLQEQIAKQKKQQAQARFMNIGGDNVALTEKQISALRQAYSQNPESADAMRTFLAKGSSADPEAVRQFLGQMSGQLGLTEDQLAVLRGSGGTEGLRQLFAGGSPLTGNQADALKAGVEAVLGALQGDPEARASLESLIKNGSIDSKTFNDIIGQVLNTDVRRDDVMGKIEGQKPDLRSIQNLVSEFEGLLKPQGQGAPIPSEFADKIAQFQTQLTPEQQALLGRLSPEQISHLATLSPQDLSANAERLLSKFGITAQELPLLASFKPEDLARLSELRDIFAQYTKASDGQIPQQGLPQQTSIGDYILAALNAPQPVPAGDSVQARIIEIGNLVAERILVTAPELNQKQEVMILLKENVLPGTQVRITRGEGGTLQLVFDVRGQDASNLIHQNMGALKDTLQNKLGESVNVSVKTEGQGREENEGRSRGQRNLIDEQEDEADA